MIIIGRRYNFSRLFWYWVFFFASMAHILLLGGVSVRQPPLLPVIVNSLTQYCIISSKSFFFCRALWSHAVFEYDSYVLDDYSKPVKGGVMCWHTYRLYIYVLGGHSRLPLAELFHIAVFSKCPLVTQSGYQKIPVSSSQLFSVVATFVYY